MPTRGRRGGLSASLFRLAILAAAALAAAWLARSGGESGVESVGGPAQIADGDSLQVGATRVRLVGLDAPEYRQTCGGGLACGRRSRDHLASLVGRGPVSCEGTGRDRYGRLLAVCVAGGVELNAAMVRNGWAVADGNYFGEEREARAARRGIWATDFEAPRQWRREHLRDDIPASGGASRILDWIDATLTGILAWFKSVLAR